MLVVKGALCWRFGGRVLFLTIPVVGIVYGMLDVAWIRSEMARPDWNGQPDQDVVFVIGMMLRTMVAAILLFASFVLAILFSNAMHECRYRGKTETSDNQAVNRSGRSRGS